MPVSKMARTEAPPQWDGLMPQFRPVLEEHCGVTVVRDDLYPGGTKARAFEHLFARWDEIVYCCAAISCTQISLAAAARRIGKFYPHGKRATLFVPGRAEVTKQTEQAVELGGEVHAISPGYANVVRARAAEYVNGHERVLLAPLGFDMQEVIDILAGAARMISFTPDEVWCAAGSGVLTRSLQQAWPMAKHHAVLVGASHNIGTAVRHESPLKFEKAFKGELEFPSERHFDAKAWDVCKKCRTGDANRRVLFWNVMGDVP